ncbi:TetR family transcriptional regulator [Streptomyces sp. RFCAC02]|uniref:TetR/AcrR family transcriptional regulator n=1 Tax=Streptomyces sp. RFCAC02 TaxID=2499143 RepID=UPI00101F1C30|nr:TetR family transcriptional regulator [Streptomyces sp. RFCAC02]
MTAAPGHGGRPRRGPGRPPRAAAADGTPDTRQRILASARAAFGEHGYDKASIRAIARGADVNPALVHHYFGTKEGVFAAAVAAAAEPAVRRLPEEARFPVAEFGLRFTRLFFRVWEDPVTRSPLLAVVRSAVVNETAARIFRAYVGTELLGRIAGGLDAPDARLRAELAAGQLVGVVLLRYVLQVEPLAGADVEDLIRRLAPVVQQHLTGTP